MVCEGIETSWPAGVGEARRGTDPRGSEVGQRVSLTWPGHWEGVGGGEARQPLSAGGEWLDQRDDVIT